MTLYINHYTCSDCNVSWDDEYDSQSDDTCLICGKPILPWQSEEVIQGMEPYDAWLYTASWGSLVSTGDPGACMYGFSEDCRPQSEKHRQDVIDWMRGCRNIVEKNPKWYESDALETLDSFVDFITTRAVAVTVWPCLESVGWINSA